MRKSLLTICSFLLATGSYAQSYSLTEMTAEQFESGGGETPWTFEKLSYTDKVFTEFSLFGENSMANYLDIYNPERLMTKRITEIDGVVANGNNTLASNLRQAWYNEENDGSSTAERLMYVAQDEREGFGFEIYGLTSQASAITFTAPENGYYNVEGTICREDNGLTEPLYLTPQFRYASVTDGTVSGPTGLSFAFGGDGGEIEGYDGNGHLNNGATQRYISQTPTNFVMSVQLKKGDKLSFAVSGAPYDHRGSWARCFMQSLIVSLTDEATATSCENYLDPYGTSNIDGLREKVNEFGDLLLEMQVDDLIGESAGQYPTAKADALSALLERISGDIDAGDVNNMNASKFVEELENAWNEFISSKIVMDYSADGNYWICQSTGSIDEDNLEVTINSEMMEENDNDPFGFYYYTNSMGEYTAFPNHDDNGLAGSNSWYYSSSKWLYIADDGSVHPDYQSRNAAYMFTAPMDGVWLVNAKAYRPNPNERVTNPLTLTSRYLPANAESVDSSSYIVQNYYGNVKTDGKKGKAPTSFTYFVQLKAGDRITVEIGAPISNASAGTQMLDLAFCSRAHADSIFTTEIAEASGIMFFNPYEAGNPDSLLRLIAYADSVVAAVEDHVGDGDGQYAADYYEEVKANLDAARELVSTENVNQLELNTMYTYLYKSLTSLLESRMGYHISITGDYSIRLAGTSKRLTQNNSAGGYYYANFFDIDGVIGDAARFDDYEASDYNWTFTFKKDDTSDYGHVITVDNGYMTQDGYICKGVDEDEESKFEFITENEGDTVFAIRRADGLYWGNTMNWSSPYNKISTSSTPLYIFVVDKETIINTITSVDQPIATGNRMVSGMMYFDLNGRPVGKSYSGVVIVKTTYTDGTTEIHKQLNR